jgi:hypothetical protein
MLMASASAARRANDGTAVRATLASFAGMRLRGLSGPTGSVR